MQALAAGAGEPVGALHESVAAGQAGERVEAGGVQLAAYADVVDEGRQGERHGGRGDDECAGRQP
ncbi:hypothetical protein E4K73_47560 [Streptomyces sp. IB201691-2A2]|nr:hypothetical protein E4K73_47560 [Streptomyces sp. IB201691-2A2]